MRWPGTIRVHSLRERTTIREVDRHPAQPNRIVERDKLEAIGARRILVWTKSLPSR